MDKQMTGHDALKALERAVDERCERDGLCRNTATVICLGDVRSALAQSGPQAVGVLVDAANAKGYAVMDTAPQEAGGEREGGTLVVEDARYVYLCARDKWIEEHAKPAMNYYNQAYGGPGSRMAIALAALPASTEGK